MLIVWKKCVSVTAGGKPHFWFASLPTGRAWVAWNRTALQWELSFEPSNAPCAVLGHYMTARRAMQRLAALVLV